MTAPSDDVGWGELPPARRCLVALLLLVPVLAVLAVPLYSRAEPSLGGVPFFYWSQFAAIPTSMVAMAAALRLLAPSARRRGSRAVGDGGQQDP